MFLVVVHLDRDVLVHAFLELPACGKVGVEIQHGPIHLVAEAAASLAGEFLFQVARRQGDLVRRGADGGLEVDPVGIVGQVGVGARGLVFQLGHAHGLAKVALATLVAVLDLSVLAVAETREHAAVDEAAVLDDLLLCRLVGNAVGVEVQVEADLAFFTWLQGLVQAIDAIAKRLVVQAQLRAPHFDCRQGLVIVHHHVHVGDRHGMRVVDPVNAAHLHRLGFRTQVHVDGGRKYLGLRQVPVLAEFALVAGLQVQYVVG